MFVRCKRRSSARKRFSAKKQRKMEDRKMQKSIFEQMGGTYTQVGDYLIPNLMLDEREQSPPWQIWADAKT